MGEGPVLCLGLSSASPAGQPSEGRVGVESAQPGALSYWLSLCWPLEEKQNKGRGREGLELILPQGPEIRD